MSTLKPGQEVMCLSNKWGLASFLGYRKPKFKCPKANDIVTVAHVTYINNQPYLFLLEHEPDAGFEASNFAPVMQPHDLARLIDEIFNPTFL